MTRITLLQQLLPLTVLALALGGGGGGGMYWCAQAGGGFNLTLLHTGQTFAQVTAVDLLNSPCMTLPNGSYVSTAGFDPCLGGMDRRKTAIERARAAAQNSVLIDSGGLFTGSLFWYLYNSTILTDYYRDLGYQAVGLTLYEFFSQIPPLAYFIKNMDGVRVVAANLENWDIDPRFDNQTVYAYAVFDFPNGEKVGYACTVVPDIRRMFSNSYPIDSTTELAGMLKAVGELQNQGVNKIIVSLSGITALQPIIDTVLGIDIVVLSDTFYGNPTPDWELDFTAPTASYPQVHMTAWNQPVLIVGSGSFGKYVGALNVTFDDHGVLTAWQGNSIQINDKLVGDPAIYANVMADYANLENSLGLVIGEDAVAMGFEYNCLFGECAIGDWTAENFRSFGKTQIGLVNGGSFDKGLPLGPVTLGDLMVANPFGGANQLWTFNLTADVLLQALEHSVYLATTGAPKTQLDTGRFLQVAGLNFTWNPYEPSGSRVVDVWIEVESGKWRLMTDLNATYTITTIDYIAKGGDDFTMFAQNATHIVNLGAFSNQPLLDSLAASLTAAAGPLDVGVDGRISLTNFTRRSCLSGGTPDQPQLCSGNGYCYQGTCVCTVAGASGPLCVSEASSQDSSSSGLSSGAIAGIVIGAIVPVVLLILVLVLTTVWALGYAYRRKNLYEDDWTLDINELALSEQLGQGGFGEVRKASWKGTEVAVKIMPQSASSKNKAMVANFAQEARVMSKLRHPNVVLFMGACVKPPHLCIVMEFMALGSLFDLLHNELVSEIPWNLRIKLMFQAAKGMAHRDLKSLNLLLDAKWNLKVADFGLTTFKNSLKREDQMLGSVFWMAPEVLAEENNVDEVLADVYSFGIVLWEVLTRGVLYEGYTQPQVAIGVITQGLRPAIPENIISERELQYIELMRSCWQQDEQRRPIFLNIMAELESLLDTGVHNDSSSSSSRSSYFSSNRQQPWSSSFGWNSASESTSTDGRSDVGEGMEASASTTATAALAKGDAVRTLQAAPRQDVSYIVCDLVQCDRLWASNPLETERLIELYGRLIKGYAHAHQGHIFSKPSFHSGGTFMIAFREASRAVSFALGLAQDVLAHPTLSKHSRISVSHRPGFNKPPKNDQLRTSYELKDYEEACMLNMACPAGAVLCAASFHSLAAVMSTDGSSSSSSSSSSYHFRPFKEGVSYLLIINGHQSEDESAGLLAGGGYDEDDYEDDRRAAAHHDQGLCSSNSCPWIIDRTSLTIGEPIGEGSYGQVFKAKYMETMRVAVKRLYNSKLDDDSLRRMRREAAMLFDLEHPNIVKLIGLSLGHGGPHSDLIARTSKINGASASSSDASLMLVMELVDGPNLRTLLSDSRKSLSWKQKLNILMNAALGIAHLHERGIIHRDIKSSNLLVDAENQSVKVGDFGFATAKQQNATMTRCGTPAWTAPELLAASKGGEQQEQQQQQLSTGGGASLYEKVDVYSFGIVMWEVLTRRMPYEDRNMVELIKEVLGGHRPAIPSDCPPQFADMLKRCWRAKPHKRPSMEEVVMFLNTQIDGLDV